LIIIPLIILLITLADQSSVHLFKEVFERLRPCHNPELQEYIHLVKGHCGGKYGFISSHAANTFALAVFLKNIYRIRWLSVLLLSWATIVSYSRIYIGVHYPFDVIAGVVWGALLGYGIYRLYLLFESKLWKS
jgi:undecaprenyl-diphosphatase